MPGRLRIAGAVGIPTVFIVEASLSLLGLNLPTQTRVALWVAPFLVGLLLGTWHHRPGKVDFGQARKKLVPALRALCKIPSECAYVKKGIQAGIRQSHVVGMDIKVGWEALQDLLEHWSGHWTDEHDIHDGLWRLVFDIYMGEERRDVEGKHLATNIQLYTDLLVAFFDFYCAYDGCHIVVLTSVLPSEWWGCGIADQQQSYTIQSYRERQEGLVHRLKQETGNRKTVERYIVVRRSESLRVEPIRIRVDEMPYVKQDNYRSMAALRHDIKTHRPQAEAYITKLHVTEEAAKVVEVAREYDPHKDMNDLLMFTRTPQTWEWAVKSTVRAEQPTMHVDLYDKARLALNNREFNGYNLYEFYTWLQGQPTYTLRALLNGEVAES